MACVLIRKATDRDADKWQRSKNMRNANYIEQQRVEPSTMHAKPSRILRYIIITGRQTANSALTALRCLSTRLLLVFATQLLDGGHHADCQCQTNLTVFS